MAFLRRRTQVLHHRPRIRFLDDRQQSAIHHVIFDFGIDRCSAGRFDRFGCGHPVGPAVLGQVDAVPFEQRAQCLNVAVLGLDDIHERPDRAKGFDDLSVGCARPVFVFQCFEKGFHR